VLSDNLDAYINGVSDAIDAFQGTLTTYTSDQVKKLGSDVVAAISNFEVILSNAGLV